MVYGLLAAIVHPNHIAGEAGSNVSNAFVRVYGGVNVFIRNHSLCKCRIMFLLLPLTHPAICKPGCQRGSCFVPGECICAPGFTGELCDECSEGWAGDDCSQGHHRCFVSSLSCPAICSEGCLYGTCAVPGICTCNEGYSGANCTECMLFFHSFFHTTAVCLSCVNGECTAPGVCTCNEGWSGSGCAQGLFL